ncbi:MAG: DUF1501 domain-containing protein [Bacteriovoracaceae bacterium]|jgi:hypothetical protein|nr:DUF1501 domain-containing protein [Bacteriovoracaceae bacterium]
MNRRDFSKFIIFFQSMVLANNTYAEKITRENYILINIPGAPARWLMDGVIIPSTHSKAIIPEMFANYISSYSTDFFKLKFSYKTIDSGNGIRLPLIWSQSLPSSKGRMPMLDLTQNMLVIRGCDMLSDGHQRNNKKLDMPVGSGLSLTGMLADRSRKTIPAVSLGSSYSPLNTASGVFKSKKSDHIIVKGDTPNPFEYIRPLLINSTEQMHASLLKKINERLHGDLSTHSYLPSKRIDSMFSFYQASLLKYKSLINEALLEDIQGLTNRPIPGLKITDLEKLKFAETNNVKVALGKLQHEGMILGHKDIRNIYKFAKINSLANQFAMLEVLIFNNLSSSIVIDIDTISNLFYENTFELDHFHFAGEYIKLKNEATPSAANSQKNQFSIDSHDSGLVSTAIFNTKLWLTLSTCINEFIIGLKNKEMFSNTLIHITSEFERIPSPDSSGSEHGFNGHTSTLISGKIKQFETLGNIRLNSDEANDFYKNIGSWGRAAPIKNLSNRSINYGNIISTLATILNIPSPTPHEIPLVNVKKGKVIPLIGRGENV